MSEKMKSQLKRSEGPPPPRVKFDWDAIAEQLRSEPGEWFLVFEEGPVTVATSIRQGDTKALTDPHFEVATANNTPGPGRRTCTLWLRWNPEKSKDKVSKLKKEKA